MKNQTAVEWLVNELNQKIDFIPMDKWDIIRDIVQQALAMEKEQIIDAYYYDPNCGKIKDDGEQYYNETYGS
jgi:predicted kinase